MRCPARSRAAPASSSVPWSAWQTWGTAGVMSRVTLTVAGGLSREGDVRWGCAVVQEGCVSCQSVVDSGRIRVLGGKPVVDGDDFGAGPPADLRGQLSCEEGVP